MEIFLIIKHDTASVVLLFSEQMFAIKNLNPSSIQITFPLNEDKFGQDTQFKF